MPYTCGFCQEKKEVTHLIKEQMFGTNDTFAYAECEACHSLQIKEIPEDMSRYYPKNYYSFSPRPHIEDGPAKRFLRQELTTHYLTGNSLVGRALCSVLRRPTPEHFTWFKIMNIGQKDRILDVGCGAGDILSNLRLAGFDNLTGIDPFLPTEIVAGSGFKLLRRELFDMDGEYDLIMFNHSFEHLRNPSEYLKAAAALVNKNHYVMLRLPIAYTWAWRSYGVNWAQIDAPRHLFIPSIKGMETLCASLGLQIKNILFDSTELQFVGSEQFLNGIPLRSPHSYYENPNGSIFSAAQIKSFQLHAEQLNASKDGDSACFFLSKNE